MAVHDKEEGMSKEEFKEQIKNVLQELKISAAKEEEFKETVAKVEKHEGEISDLKNWCRDHPDSPICQMVDRKVNKGFVQKATSGERKVVPLPVINPEIRSSMRPDQTAERTRRAKDMMDFLNVSSVDNLNVINLDPESKKNLPIHIIKNAPPQQLAEALSTCSLRGDCDKVYAEMKRQGINLQFKDGKKWKDAAKEEEEEKEGPHI